LLYINSNKSLRQILIRKIVLVIFLPILVSSLLIGFFTLSNTYTKGKNYLRLEGILFCQSIEKEVISVEKTVNFLKTLYPDVDEKIYKLVIDSSLTENQYIMEYGFNRDFSGWGEGVISYKINDDYILRFKLDVNDYFLKIETSDGSVIANRYLVPKNYFPVQYYSERLKWNFQLYQLKPPLIVTPIAVIFVLFILLVFVGTMVFIGNIESTLKKTVDSLLSISKDISIGNYKFQLPEIELSDFYHVAESFSIMADLIETRENDILKYRGILEEKVLDRTKKLTETVNSLKDMQEKLVESEKMASLGFLVTGISHEVNTPLGVIVTGITFMQDEINELEQAFIENSVTRRYLTEFINRLKDTVELVTSNSIKVKNLINNFKMVARDQESDDIRDFDMIDYIELIITNVKQKYLKKSITVNLNYVKEITLHTYPGALYKVLYNLLINSYIYAFPESNSGTINISISDLGDVVEIIYSDNGVGMNQDVIYKVFEPFYTTDRSEGKTGLGMFIVYNQITLTLKGSIKSMCIPGEGATFVLRIPKSIDPQVE